MSEEPVTRARAKVLSASRSVMNPPPGVESRVVDAWCEWLDAMATDAEAALAAAMAYKSLEAAARDSWLGALEQDAHRLTVPAIAVYAPLLAVETDRARRARIVAAIGPLEDMDAPTTPPRGYWAIQSSGVRIAVVVSPLYLDFVQVLACGYRPTDGFDWVRHDPIVDRGHAPEGGSLIEGVAVEPTPLKALIDDLALAVLAHTRHGRKLPDALRVYADLFGPSEGTFTGS